jgi:putative flavoprotein involved in K+ transport
LIDDYIQKSQLYAPPPDNDPDDVPDETASFAPSTASLNLKGNNITSIIWATGVTGDFSYLKFPVFNGIGMLKHNNGISETEGLYFLGLPWLRKRKSGIILGIEEDAMFITRQILEHSGKHK